MGMPYAVHAISARRALALMAPLRVPTSTIQILVLTLAGAGLAARPSYLLTRALDRLPAIRVAASPGDPVAAGRRTGAGHAP